MLVICAVTTTSVAVPQAVKPFVVRGQCCSDPVVLSIVV